MKSFQNKIISEFAFGIDRTEDRVCARKHRDLSLHLIGYREVDNDNVNHYSTCHKGVA